MAKSKSNAKSSAKTSSRGRVKAKSSTRSKKSTSRKKASPNQSLEIIITLALFFGFLIYGAGQCNKAKVAYDFADASEISSTQEVQFKTAENAVTQSGIDQHQPNAKVVNSPEAQINLPKLAQKSSASANSSNQPKINSTNVVKFDTLQQFNQLWVTIDQLKLRSEPKLNSEVLMQIPLFDRVYYLNQKTDFSQEINLGTELANEPWLFIQHPNGIKGWCYGAGLNFHKEKRVGTQ